MAAIPDLDPELWEKFELFVARVVAINSIEGSLALIHDQVSSHYVQTTKDNKMIFEKIVDKKDTETVEILKNASLAECRFKKNKRAIIWTADQLKIITTVVELFQDPSRGELRLLVKGCKGSGKTMLLVYFAGSDHVIIQEVGSDHVIIQNNCTIFYHLLVTLSAIWVSSANNL